MTIGSVLWIRSELRGFFDISYALYGMLLIVILLVSELWALFIQIPSITGYNEIVAQWFNVLRKIVGVILLVGLIIFIIVFCASPENGKFRLYLAETMYRFSGYSHNNFVERLKTIDEKIERGVADAEQFAERGRIYLETAKIKAEGTEEYKYRLPKETSEECYKKAIKNFGDAIVQDGEVAEYYYLRGKAKCHDSTLGYGAVEEDLRKAIELDDTVPDYDFYYAWAWYGISIDGADSTDSDETIENARNYIESAIRKYLKKKSDSEKEDESGSDAEADTDDESADKLDSANQDKTLAEYYYYAGLINVSMGTDESRNEAIKNFENATTYDSENAEYFSKLENTYYERGMSDDLSKAETAFEHAISIDETDSNYSNKGYHLTWKAYVIEQDRTRIDEAIAVYEDALKCKAEDVYSYRRLVDLYKVKKDDESVKNICSRAINNCIGTEKAKFYYERGRIHYIERDYNQAITDMEKAMESDSSCTANACYCIGRSHHLLADYDEAYKYYQLAKDNGSDGEDIDEYMEECHKYKNK